MVRLTLAERLRIERAVWTLDWLVQDVPGRRRRSIRRDLRANLRAAATDVGAAQAIRNLGGLRSIAADYLAAEYGDRVPRPDVRRGIAWAVLTVMVLLGLAAVSCIAFQEGVTTVTTSRAGTYTFDDLTVLGFNGTVIMFEDGGWQWELDIYLWLFAYPLAALVVGGRLWRYGPAWWRARRRT